VLIPRQRSPTDCVNRSRNWKSRQGPTKGCTAIGRYIETTIEGIGLRYMLPLHPLSSDCTKICMSSVYKHSSDFIAVYKKYIYLRDIADYKVTREQGQSFVLSRNLHRGYCFRLTKFWPARYATDYLFANLTTIYELNMCRMWLLYYSGTGERGKKQTCPVLSRFSHKTP
jgi:hypothetical protein